MQRNVIAMTEPKSLNSEQYRTIRTNIEFASVDRQMKSVMITSACPGEGKSTTAANLAVVFAQQGKKVLLIDADLRKPTVHTAFFLENTVGLTSVLLKKSSMEQLLQRRLSIMYALGALMDSVWKMMESFSLYVPMWNISMG